MVVGCGNLLSVFCSEPDTGHHWALCNDPRLCSIDVSFSCKEKRTTETAIQQRSQKTASACSSLCHGRKTGSRTSLFGNRSGPKNREWSVLGPGEWSESSRVWSGNLATDGPRPRSVGGRGNVTKPHQPARWHCCFRASLGHESPGHPSFNPVQSGLGCSERSPLRQPMRSYEVGGIVGSPKGRMGSALVRRLTKVSFPGVHP